MAAKAPNREFELIAACSRPLQDPNRSTAVRRAMLPDLDWQHLLRLAQWHRVEPHVLDGLRSAGIELPQEALPLAGMVTAGATDRLAYIAETLRLAALFEEAGIDVLCFKGAPLEQLAYRRTGFKQSRDIDLLVDARDLDRAHALLGGLGYLCVYPAPAQFARMQAEPARRAAFLRSDKETVWRLGKLVVEIHWRLVTSRVLLPGVGLASPRQSVELMRGRAVATLALPELFAYLALHGAYHGWPRLKWLADLVALVADLPDDELAGLHDRAVALGVGRCSAQALLLGEMVLGLSLAPALSARLATDPAVPSMISFGASVLAAPVAEGRVHDQPRFGGRLLRLHWQLSRAWPYRLEMAAKSAAMLADRVRERLRRRA